VLINASSIALLFQGFKGNFNKGLQGAKTHFRDIAMVVPSSTREEKYGWLGQFPKLREWIGDRQVTGLVMHDYAIANKKFELTIAVQRDDIEDDQYNVYAPLMEEMGKSVAEHPDEIIFALLAQGFTTLCYDGQPFFDDEHPIKDHETGNITLVSNFGGDGAQPAWFLLDTTRAIKPMVWQERVPFTFQSLVSDNDEHVFKHDEHLYGIRGRANAGFALWQLAYGSKQALDSSSYAAARLAMRSLRGDEGRPLGIMPNLLVVSPANEAAAREILVAERDSMGATNVWQGSAGLVVSSWLAT
jgi:phage major head subunit gpT-like protein